MTEVNCNWQGCPTNVQRTSTGTLADGLFAHLVVVHQVSRPIALGHVTARIGPPS